MNGKYDGNQSLTQSYRKHVGNKLREKRLEKNYSLQAVANDTGHSKSTISNIENGSAKFSLEIMGELAAYYGIPLDTLLASAM